MIDQILTLKEVAAYLKLEQESAHRLGGGSKLPSIAVCRAS